MARSVTVANIIQRARVRADMRHSQFITDPEALDMLNECYGELYDLLVQCFQNYFTSTQIVTLVPGTVSYALPADFYKMITIEQVNGDGSFTTIFGYNEIEKNSTIGTSPNSIPAVDVRFRYVPAPAVFADTASTIDGVSGWDSLLVYDLGIMFKEAEESDTSGLERHRAAIAQRIQSNAQNRDLTLPGRITDVTVFDNAAIKNELRYRFYGSNIEFLTVTYAGV